jgi:hypothetical protein
MQASNLTIVIGVLGLVATSFVGSMVWAYKGSGSVAVLFREVVPVPVGLSEGARRQFQAGVSDYIAGRYRRALSHFTQVLQGDPTCAAARHNCGLAYANLRQEDSAMVSLLAAAETYGTSGDNASVGLVKRHLSAIRSRKLAREQAI